MTRHSRRNPNALGSIRPWQYRDPLQQLLDAEARTCKGCVYTVLVFERQACSKGKIFGRRCRQYIEREGREMIRRAVNLADSAWAKPDGTALCLDLWRWWMGLNDRDMGSKTSRAEGDGTGNDDTQQIRRDIEVAEATDAMINGLTMRHRWAILRTCGLSTVWRYPNESLANVFEEATAALAPKLKKNVATRLLFE